MQHTYIAPVNFSKLGFRYFRIVVESKLFSKKFIKYVTSHPNVGYVFEGRGWSGKKRVLGIGIWATTNAEISDLATRIRAMLPESYKVVYQSELTRLEYYRDIDGTRTAMVLLDELERKQEISPLEIEYLKLISVDGGLGYEQMSALLNVPESEVSEISKHLKQTGVYYGVFENEPLPHGYTKFFVDTAALHSREVEYFYKLLTTDPNCVYFARGNGKYNLEFEYILSDVNSFTQIYKKLIKNSKKVTFDENVFTNLFPQSKFLNAKSVQEKFIELEKTTDKYFDLRNSELWYVSQEGAKAYLDVYSNEQYRESMQSGETNLFKAITEHVLSAGQAYKINVIDLGSGDGYKAKALIESFGSEHIKSYFPVDIQEIELAHAIRVHKDAPYAVHPTVLRFNNISARFPLVRVAGEGSLFCLFGGTYGNFKSQEINSYLESALAKEDKLLVGMPIRDYTNKSEIKKSYLNETIEKIGFSVLKMIGFERGDFEENKEMPGRILQPKWKGDLLVQTFTLKKDRTILGAQLEAGTTFDIMSSWKPTLEEFETTLADTFVVEKMFNNKHFAIALCCKKG